MLGVVGLLVFPGVVGAIARAATPEPSGGAIGNSALSWMEIRDSDGVALADYIFASNYSFLDPIDSTISLIIDLELTGYLTIVIIGIWLIGYILSFQWLDLIAEPLRGVAAQLTEQLDTPLLIATVVTIGGLLIGFYLMRGKFAAATSRTLWMVCLAVFAPLVLAQPLGETLSSHGVLVVGRDLGVSLAAGLTGDSDPDPAGLTAKLQERMASSQRSVVQAWNFGRVVDTQPACRAAWSYGVRSGDADRIKDGLRGCGAADAAVAADNPGIGQVGAGLVLLIAALIQLGTLCYLAVRIPVAACGGIIQGFRLIIACVGPGYADPRLVIGPIVHGGVLAAQMVGHIVVIWLWLLVTENFARQAGPDQAASVLIIGAVVQAGAIPQLRKVSAAIHTRGEFLTDRVAAAVRNGGEGSGAGGGGGSGGGMGATNAGGVMADLGTLNTLNSSAPLAWLLAGTPNPLSPLARANKISALANAKVAQDRIDQYRENAVKRSRWIHVIRNAAAEHGGLNNPRTAVRALDELTDEGLPKEAWVRALMWGGIPENNAVLAANALHLQGNRAARSSPFAFKPAQTIIGSVDLIEPRLAKGSLLTYAEQAEFASQIMDENLAPLLRRIEGATVDRTMVDLVLRNAHSAKQLREELLKVGNKGGTEADVWNSMGAGTRITIAKELNERYKKAAQDFVRTVRMHGSVPKSELGKKHAVEEAYRKLFKLRDMHEILDHIHPTQGADIYSV
ncbi:hypothetical protein [Nocardia sp. NPDC051832]|uniref:hypothetical protein n=1 Tax=Nocardia sp. NPDC051832 TaxID=3155673 RepID=UPI003438255C